MRTCSNYFWSWSSVMVLPLILCLTFTNKSSDAFLAQEFEGIEHLLYHLSMSLRDKWLPRGFEVKLWLVVSTVPFKIVWSFEWRPTLWSYWGEWMPFCLDRFFINWGGGEVIVLYVLDGTNVSIFQTRVSLF